MSAVARWDAFLAQIQGRHEQARAEADGSARQFIAQVAAGGDVQPLSHQLMALKGRLQDLEKMIIDTWHAKVDAAFEADGRSNDERVAGQAKGRALQHALDDAREEHEIRLLAELARARIAHGQPDGANLASHAVAQEAATSEWRAMRASLRALNDIRPPRTLAPIVAYEHAQIAYWRKYLSVRAQYEPILARDPALEVRARMEQWYVYTAEHEPAWVAAGRPRTPI